MSKIKLATDEFVPMMLGAAGALGVFPFAVLRFMTGDYLVALLDATIVVGLSCLSFYLYRTHQVLVVSRALTALAVAGVLTTVGMLGAQQMYWMYPVLVGAFFLVPRVEAIGISIAALVGFIILCGHELGAVSMATVLMTFIVTCSLAFAFATVTSQQQQSLMKLATKDPLTGAGNRRALEEKLREIIANKMRIKSQSSLLMLDLDHFKQVNDQFGHAVGDNILVQVTDIIRLRIRGTDSIFRIGGEEFVVVAENQDLKNASRLAEQLRTIIEANELAPADTVTISLGVAEYRFGETAEDWLRRADDALYVAKNKGRNNTQLAA